VTFAFNKPFRISHTKVVLTLGLLEVFCFARKIAREINEPCDVELVEQAASE